MTSFARLVPGYQKSTQTFLKCHMKSSPEPAHGPFGTEYKHTFRYNKWLHNSSYMGEGLRKIRHMNVINVYIYVIVY